MSHEERPATVCSEILGHRDEARFAARHVDEVSVSAEDASKRRLRLRTESGRDVGVDLPRGSFLADGAVLDDDGDQIMVVHRPPEPIMRVRIDRALDSDARVAAALRLGHAFGNQHVPVEVAEGELLVAITTSQDVARRTLEALHLDGVDARFEEHALAQERPLSGHAHSH